MKALLPFSLQALAAKRTKAGVRWSWGAALAEAGSASGCNEGPSVGAQDDPTPALVRFAAQGRRRGERKLPRC